jgi:hypothetical protein
MFPVGRFVLFIDFVLDVSSSELYISPVSAAASIDGRPVGGVVFCRFSHHL